MSKAISLLLLRFSTGAYLVIWGIIKLAAPEKATQVSDKYYAGLLNPELLNYGLGIAEIIIGLLVIIGLFRNIAYTAQGIIYLVGLLAIMPYILDPFGLYLNNEAKVTFFPSTTLFFASVVMIAFKSSDTLSIDSKRNKA